MFYAVSHFGGKPKCIRNILLYFVFSRYCHIAPAITRCSICVDSWTKNPSYCAYSYIPAIWCYIISCQIFCLMQLFVIAQLDIHLGYAVYVNSYGCTRTDESHLVIMSPVRRLSIRILKTTIQVWTLWYILCQWQRSICRTIVVFCSI